MASLPSLEDARAWVNLPATVLSDVDLDRMREVAIEKVEATCRTPVDAEGQSDRESTDWSSSLVQAILRRVQREIAAKALPLGYIDQASEYGPARIPAYDVMIEELEGAYRRVIFG